MDASRIELRKIALHCNYTRHAEGSVMVKCGDTRVLCNASVDNRVPPFLKGKGSGWVTAEYGMLPTVYAFANGVRGSAWQARVGWTMEIQRLIGRSLRAAVDLKALGEKTITLDCDVIQADGGMRTAVITGSYVALSLAVAKRLKSKKIKSNSIRAKDSKKIGKFQ